MTLTNRFPIEEKSVKYANNFVKLEYFYVLMANISRIFDLKEN